MNKFLVVGSNCFTGSHIVDRLLSRPDASVVGVSRSSEKSDLYLPYKKNSRLAHFEFKQIDLVKEMGSLFKVLDEVQPDFVINVAALSEVAKSIETPVEYFNINTLAIVRLGQYLNMQKWLRRYIHISSAEIYGTCSTEIAEDAPLRPSTPYAVSKAAGDMYLLTAAKNKKFPVTLVRSTNVYGKHQQLFKIIPRVILYLRMKKLIELHGGGASVKSFIHVRDVCEGISRVIDCQTPRPVYHFSTNNEMTIGDIVSLICRKMDFDVTQTVRVVGERLGQDSRYWLNCSAAQRDLAWNPKVSFDAGVDEVIRWIDESWDQVVNEPLEYQHKV